MSNATHLSGLLRGAYAARGGTPYTVEEIASAAACIPLVSHMLGRGTVAEAVAAIAIAPASPVVRDLLCEVFDVPPLSSLTLA